MLAGCITNDWDSKASEQNGADFLLCATYHPMTRFHVKDSDLLIFSIPIYQSTNSLELQWVRPQPHENPFTDVASQPSRLTQYIFSGM